ncbi:unnamed protein product [Brassica rapa subsp. narinosa]
MIRSSPFRTSQVHGAKPSEVYGFVGCISTVVATVIFLIWHMFQINCWSLYGSVTTQAGIGHWLRPRI